MAKFTRIPVDTFEKITLNAGILVRAFNPATGAVIESDILGATTGGINATCVFSYIDFGDDIDNCPKNTMELKEYDSVECRIAATMLTVNTASLKSMLALADIDATDSTKVVPRVDVKPADFEDVWLVADYSDKNSAASGGFIAVHLMNALNDSGFSIQTADKNKGQFTVDFLGHFSIADQTTVPMEFYIKEGTAS